MRAPEPFEIDAGGNYPVRGEAFLADIPRGGVAICHGFKGFAHWAFFPYIARALAADGLNAVTFDFSGSGIGPDRESFTQPDAFANNTFTQEQKDLSAVIAHAKRAGWLDETFGLFGHSRGGATAIVHAANEPNANALVTWAAIAYPNRWSRDAVKGWRERGYVEIPNTRTGQVLRLGTPLLDEVESLGASTLDFESAAGHVRAPWLIVHGTADETVDCSEGERLHERSKAVSTLRLVSGANHGSSQSIPLPRHRQIWMSSSVKRSPSSRRTASGIDVTGTEGRDSHAHAWVATIRAALDSREPVRAAVDGTRRAAVAVILRARADGAPEVFFIKRADYAGDPWSGQVAFPGGRHEPSDATLAETAFRETLEETGIDLARDGIILGVLDDLSPVINRLPAIVVTPFVVLLNHAAPLTLSSEVALAFWVPFDALRHGGSWRETQVLARGVHFNARAFDHEGHIIWGMTERMLAQLISLLPKSQAY